MGKLNNARDAIFTAFLRSGSPLKGPDDAIDAYFGAVMEHAQIIACEAIDSLRITINERDAHAHTVLDLTEREVVRALTLEERG